ncbi:4'-phosphopantetheinyl transferase superfamily protein [Streptacidiphilus sp. MAP5-3]|jgi:4'-phosphopantetheinyl transferase|uniref:4'-phosphopantetheinyl transferase family protein n=1 Tax=unclassified Streptacidiphilus TaxID=2643834 RepID=UPI003515A16F
MTENRAAHAGPQRDTCQVWWARPSQVPADLVDILSPAEHERRAATGLPADRDRFTAAAVILRLALGALLGLPPDRVPVDRVCPDCAFPHGRPRLPGVPGVDCSIAHSSRLTAVAVCQGRRIGIDVEDAVEPEELDDLARMALTARESVALARCPRRDRPRHLAQVWTAKEAVLKATGHGLRICPGLVEVRADRGGLRVIALPPLPSLTRGAALHRLRPVGAVATLAALGPGPLRVREHPAAALYDAALHETAAHQEVLARRAVSQGARTGPSQRGVR